MSMRKDGSGAAELVDSLAKPEEVIANRSGDVLIKQTLLKADHFPGCQNTKLTPLLDGAPNFRQVDSLPVYGVAIPTVRGLRNVLDVLGAANGQRKVFWHNMREEPVLYINGKPYVVREADQPFCNLEYTGIDRSRVEDMEVRLKRDVLTEAQRFDHHILVTEENDDMQVVDVWEPVTEADVQTPLEVYAELKADGYDINYLRVPVTDEKAPKDTDFETLIQRLWKVPAGAALVFNCQMGRGRTTTGMIIASLVMLRRMKAFPASAHDAADTHHHDLPAVAAVNTISNGSVVKTDVKLNPASESAMLTASNISQESTQNGSSIPEWFLASGAAQVGLASPPSPPRDRLKAGMYGVIRSLLRVLERGNMGKAILDAVIDAASAMQNLREAIATYRGRLLAEQKEHKRAMLMGVCLEYLERYYMLIAFTSYLTWSKFDPDSGHHISFPEWTSSRPELRSVLLRMLRRNPMAALELHFPAATLPPGTPQRPVLDEEDNPDLISLAEDQADRIVDQRNGAVLGPLTILKEDYFPGMKSHKLPQPLAQASNFRQMVGAGIYGVAMSTVTGIRNVLQKLRETSVNDNEEVLWFNMREEPVVYVNGRPFVLREQARPMKNLQEYAGIDARRLERMEQRLKDDLLAEAARYGGRVLVARESAISGGGQGELIDTWEAVAGPSAIQTPAEVYAMLRQEGYRVGYGRVPVTDGTAPQPEDMDVVFDKIRSSGLQAPIVFNCQLGAGRTTTGMVIGGLIQLYASATAAAAPLSLASSASLAHDLQLTKIQEELQGGSPKSEDDERDDGFGVEDLWEMSPEEIEEQRSLAAGGYVGVRRVIRLLEEGDNAKRAVDTVIDAAGQLINLRMAVMRYRKPHKGYKNHKGELRSRHAAFSRGSAYLERYCLLIAFSAYLQQQGLNGELSFSQWLDWRPELKQALASIHTNPAAALAAVPVAAVPVVYATVVGAEVTEEEQQQVLNKRRGRTLTRRIILKSYLNPTPDPTLPPGTPDMRQADDLPIYTVGNVDVSALRRLLSHLGAGPSGHTHVVLSDVREELVVYVNGVPYIRRELEMPAAALHHAGVHWRQLEQLEKALKEDVRAEAQKWGCKVLLHHEVSPSDLARKSSSNLHGMCGPLTRQLPPGLAASFLTPPNAPFTRQTSQLRAAFLSPSVVARPAPVIIKAVAGQVPSSNPTLPSTANGVKRVSGSIQVVQDSQSGLNGVTASIPVSSGTAAAAKEAVADSSTKSVNQIDTVSPAAVAAAGTADGSVNPVTADNQQPLPSNGTKEQPIEFPGFKPFAARLVSHDLPQIQQLQHDNHQQQYQGQKDFNLAQQQQQHHQQQQQPHNHNHQDQEDITAPVDQRPGAAVVPFWEPVELDATADDAKAAATEGATARDAAAARSVLATCRDVSVQLADEGFNISYRRIPLSRERTPVAGDLQDLHKQVEAPQIVSPRHDATADGAAQQQVVHLVLSRTATGSSARFAAAVLATHMLNEAAKDTRQGVNGGATKRMRRSMSDLGEYRGIMAVSRLLPGGMDVKAAVDEAIDRCSRIGNLREDIKACKHIAESAPYASSEDPQTAAWAARQLGVHYLKRYFLLISFRCYLMLQAAQAAGGGAGSSSSVSNGSSGCSEPVPSFEKWMDDRKELGFMLNHLTLDT